MALHYGAPEFAGASKECARMVRLEDLVSLYVPYVGHIHNF